MGKERLFSKKRVLLFIVFIIILLSIDFASLLYNDGDTSLIRQFVGYENHNSSRSLQWPGSYIYPTWNYLNLICAIVSIFLVSALIILLKYIFSQKRNQIIKNDIKFSLIICSIVSMVLLILAYRVISNPYAGKSESYRNIDVLIKNYSEMNLDYYELRIVINEILLYKFSSFNNVSYSYNGNVYFTEDMLFKDINNDDKYEISKSGDNFPITVYINKVD